MNYGFDVRMDTPQYVDVMRNAEERAYRESQDRKKAFQNMMQMLSRGAAAYKLKRDYDNYLDNLDGEEKYNAYNAATHGGFGRTLADRQYTPYNLDLAKLGLLY